MSKKQRLGLNRDELEKILQEAWDDILSRYYHPLIRERPEFKWTTEEEKALDENGRERENNLTYINMATHKTIIAEDTLQKVLPYIGPDVALKGLILHEIGHYCNYPRELATLLLMGHAADSSLGKDIGRCVLAQYMDIVDDLDNLRDYKRKAELAELYRALSMHFNDLVAGSEDKDELMGITKPNRLLFAYYQHVLDQDWGITLEDELKHKLEEMKSIDFNPKTDYSHSLSLIALGNIMKDIIPRGKGNIPGMGNNPLKIDDDADIKGFTDGQFQEALNKIPTFDTLKPKVTILIKNIDLYCF